MDNYERFQELINNHPAGAPQSQAFLEILRLLFTEEEIVVALAMSFKNKRADEIAVAAGIPVDRAAVLLEQMADKVVISCRERDGEHSYALIPTIPGLFEFPLMRGGGTPLTDRLGVLWEEYHAEAMGVSFSGNPTPLVRVVPVGKSLEGVTTVHPYEEVAHFVASADYIAVTNCACRVSVGKCDAPRDVCMIFGPFAEFLVKRKYAWSVSKEEAMTVLDRAEEAGLVHVSNNSRDRAGLICNCCPCCCTVLRGKTQLNHPHAFAVSRFSVRVDESACTGCGICAEERCPMGAIDMASGIAVVSADRCIGCGLCVSACPAEAMSLTERAAVPAVPATIQEMGAQVLQEKGKLEGFLKIMGR